MAVNKMDSQAQQSIMLFRYVNVCAAVCLLLLVGGLTPNTAAAPHRTMDRSKRASDQENETWSNPCDYNKSYINRPLEYNPELAEKVALQASDTLRKAKSYEQDVARIHSYDSFSQMLDTWKNHLWLKSESNKAWDSEELLPSDKVYGQNATEEQINNTVEKINETLPAISKALKVLGAGLQAVGESFRYVDVADRDVQPNFKATSADVRHVLCLTSDLMRARGIPMMPHFDSEIPKFENSDEIHRHIFLVYRDTVNFLSYIEEVFMKLYKDGK